MSWIGEIIGSGVGKAVGEAVTPFTNAWVETKKSAAATHAIDKQTDRDITIASYQADVQLGLAQRLLAAADATHWSTRWIRPVGAALAYVWIGASLVFWMLGKVPAVEIDPVVKYLLAGIVGAIFVFRTSEKNKRAELAGNAAAGTAPQPGLFARLAGKGKPS